MDSFELNQIFRLGLLLLFELHFADNLRILFGLGGELARSGVELYQTIFGRKSEALMSFSNCGSPMVLEIKNRIGDWGGDHFLKRAGFGL